MEFFASLSDSTLFVWIDDDTGEVRVTQKKLGDARENGMPQDESLVVLNSEQMETVVFLFQAWQQDKENTK